MKRKPLEILINKRLYTVTVVQPIEGHIYTTLNVKAYTEAEAELRATDIYMNSTSDKDDCGYDIGDDSEPEYEVTDDEPFIVEDTTILIEDKDGKKV